MHGTMGAELLCGHSADHLFRRAGRFGWHAGSLSIFVLLAAACGTFIACAVCILFVMAYAYVYLTHHNW